MLSDRHLQALETVAPLICVSLYVNSSSGSSGRMGMVMVVVVGLTVDQRRNESINQFTIYIQSIELCRASANLTRHGQVPAQSDF